MSSTFHVKPAFAADANVNAERAHVMRNHAAERPDEFWLHEAHKRLQWITPPTEASASDFGHGGDDVRISWFADGVLNASVNCLDRHLPQRSGQMAFHWQGDEPDQSRAITYADLHRDVCRWANGLRSLGVRKGDRVAIYLPMIPQAIVAMLACARIGAVHCVVFAGFSPESLAKRIQDCGASLLITAEQAKRGGKTTALRQQAEKAAETCPTLRHVLIVDSANAVQAPQQIDANALMATQPDQCAPEPMQAEDPLFILYTSGSTGTPKGLVHSTGGYLLWAGFTHALSFDLKPSDVYWCTADVGWITGHSYAVYGPLLNGITSVMFEGVPNYPDAARFWQIIDRFKVSLFYTAPTALRALMREGDQWLHTTSRDSLRVLATVGEPINPEAWLWFHHQIGHGTCPIVDTWWQTETGGIMIAPIPGAVAMKPGSATMPLPGITPLLLGPDGTVLDGEAEGELCIQSSWPGQARGLYGDQLRFAETYFRRFPGYYVTGDGAKRDADGYYWITGRVDDVMNVSGHRLSAAELESALASHDTVAECAVVGMPHAVKGEGLYAFVTLKAGSAEAADDAHKKTLINHLRHAIGPIATLDALQWAPSLPKTRSGKIMRRILRKIAAGEVDSLGDVSTLAEPDVVARLIETRQIA